MPLVYGVRDGDIVWRATAICQQASETAAYGAILLDLGVVKALTGQPTPAPGSIAATGPGTSAC
jgi:surfeit locus 1 family protein